jgi:hypothetical protein
MSGWEMGTGLQIARSILRDAVVRTAPQDGGVAYGLHRPQAETRTERARLEACGARFFAGILVLAGAALAMAGAAPGEPLSTDDFKAQLVGVPLCGIPPTGPVAGKWLCTVHLPDGTAIAAGSGLLVRGVWEVEDGKICRRSPEDPMERRRCVEYEKLGDGRYKNSDGVEFCLGPCPQ